MAGAALEHVKQMAERLSFADQLSLIEHVAKQLRQTSGGGAVAGKPQERGPQDLYGIWRDHFPPDADIDAALHEIRHEWEEELREVAEE